MPRFVDLDRLDAGCFPEVANEYQRGWNDALLGAMLAAHPVDAVEVIRCKDCMYVEFDDSNGCDNYICFCPSLIERYVNPMGYCSSARKGE